MNRWIGRTVGSGQTRDCLDPWGYVQIKGTGLVQPCCAHPPVSRITPDRSLDDTFNEITVMGLRQGLLTGDLNKFCRNCSIRTPIPVFDFRTHFARYLQSDTLQQGSMTLNSDNAIPGLLAFENAASQRFELSDRIVLHAAPSDQPAPRIVFEDVRWLEHDVLDLMVQLPPGTPALCCSVHLGPDRSALRLVASGPVQPGTDAYSMVIALPADYKQGVLALTAELVEPSADATQSRVEWSFPLIRPIIREECSIERLELGGNQNAATFEAGFSFPEPKGRWTDGPAAILRVPLAADQQVPRFLLIGADAYTVSATPPRKVRFSIGQELLMQTAFQHEVEMPTINLDLAAMPLKQGEPLRIKIETENPVSPHSTGASDDVRQLGLFIHHLELLRPRQTA